MENEFKDGDWVIAIKDDASGGQWFKKGDKFEIKRVTDLNFIMDGIQPTEYKGIPGGFRLSDGFIKLTEQELNYSLF